MAFFHATEEAATLQQQYLQNYAEPIDTVNTVLTIDAIKGKENNIGGEKKPHTDHYRDFEKDIM